MKKNESNITKTKWNKPKLIVLLKENPEEKILAVCKSVTGLAGPAHIKFACSFSPAALCGISCSSMTVS